MIQLTAGGVFQRRYSPLMIFRLTKIVRSAENITLKRIFFPMEIPAALYSFETHFKCVRAHFRFGNFDPNKQAEIFRRQLKRLFDDNIGSSLHENADYIQLNNEYYSPDQQHLIDIAETFHFLSELWSKLIK